MSIVTYGELRLYCAKALREVERWGWRGDRHSDVVRALACYLDNNPEISALPDDTPVPVDVLEYYRFPGFATD